MRRPFVPATPDEAERHREEVAYGAGMSPWDPDPERHDTEPRRMPCTIWVRATPTGQDGKFAWKIQCPCGVKPFSGSSEESVKRKLREHLEGQR